MRLTCVLVHPWSLQSTSGEEQGQMDKQRKRNLWYSIYQDGRQGARSELALCQTPAYHKRSLDPVTKYKRLDPKGQPGQLARSEDDQMTLGNCKTAQGRHLGLTWYANCNLDGASLQVKGHIRINQKGLNKKVVSYSFQQGLNAPRGRERNKKELPKGHGKRPK